LLLVSCCWSVVIGQLLLIEERWLGVLFHKFPSFQRLAAVSAVGYEAVGYEITGIDRTGP